MFAAEIRIGWCGYNIRTVSTASGFAAAKTILEVGNCVGGQNRRELTHRTGKGRERPSLWAGIVPQLQLHSVLPLGMCEWQATE